MTARYLSGSNGFIPEATGQAVAFVRSESKFKVNKYTQIIKHNAPIGVYAKLDIDQPTRIVADAQFAWEDGDDRPTGNANQANFEWVEYATKRRDYPYKLGYQALDAAQWNPKAFYNAMVLCQCMTNRTKRVIDLLEATANWGSNYAAAATLSGVSGGTWDKGSGDPTNPFYLCIKKTILEAVRRIFLKTNSAVEMKDLRLLISPGLAILMSETDEINSFLQRSPFALAQVRGDEPGQNAVWGLPDKYAGVELVVEDSTYVNTRATAAGTEATIDTNKLFIKSDTSAILLSRPGGLDGNYGAPSFSTVQAYFYKYEAAIEAFDEPKHKRVEGHVVDQFAEKLAAAASGYLITNVK